MGNKKTNLGDLANPKNIAYTITSGFYPELASRIKWGGKPLKGGKGPIGAKYAMKRGFSNSSIRRVQKEGERESEGKGRIPSAFRRHRPGQSKFLDDGSENSKYWMEGVESGSAFVKRDKSSTKAMGQFFSPGQYVSKILGVGTPFTEDDKGPMQEAAQVQEDLEKVSYSKWMGGSELYRLYGAKVWHMAGNRKRESISNTLASWANAVTEGDTGALPENYLNEIYSRSEGKLISLAKEMAEKVFDEALSEKNLQEDLKTTEEKVEVAEEDVDEAQKAMKDPTYARHSDAKIDKRSHAQRLDILSKTEGGHDLYLDSTEMAITEDEGHGIISATAAVKKAVSKLKDPKDDTQVEALRQAVIKMFMNNIKNDFNPVIGHLKKFMNKGKDKAKRSEKDSFKKLLDAVEDERQKANLSAKKWARMGQSSGGEGPHISVGNIAAAANISFGKSTTLSKGGHTAREQAMKYVIHMIASLGDNNSRLFRQGHRVATWEDGASTYASVPMGISPNTMLFYLNGLDRSPQGTTILTGASHLLALATAAGALEEGKQYEVNQRQSQALSRSRIHHSKTNNESRAQIGALQDVSRKCHRTTTVSYSPKGLGEMMEKVMGLFYADSGGTSRKSIEEVLPSIRSDMAKYVHSWPTASTASIRKKGSISGQQRLSQTGMVNANRFWALPYIGINDNIYRGKGAVRKAGGGR